MLRSKDFNYRGGRSYLQRRLTDWDSFWWRPDPKPKTKTDVTKSYPWRERSSIFTTNWKPFSNASKTTSTLYSYNNGRVWNYKKQGPWDRFFEVTQAWKSHGNVGGPFHVIKEQVDIQQSAQVNEPLYEGSMSLIQAFTVDVPPLVAQQLTTTELQALGASAVARVLPTNPNADLATFLGELREGLPSIPGLATYRNQVDGLRKSAGDEYLNVAFGWQPMVRDLRKFAHSYKHSTLLLERFVKGSDKKIRRQYHFPEEKTTKVYTNVRVNTGSNNTGYTLLNGDVSDEITINRWFSGAFRYHVPGGNTALERMKRYESEVNHLLGIRLTPEVLWNLSPWTWMLDWFGNVGDVMTNVSRLGQDGLVMQYGYVMEHVETTRTITSSYKGKPLRTVIRYSSKRRIGASPYGFGVSIGSLTKKQWAILAALGLSKSGPRNAASFTRP